MDRRRFLSSSIVSVGAGAAGLSAPAHAKGVRHLTMVTSWGRGLAGVFDAAQFVADTVGMLTDGQLKIEIKAAGELVGPFSVFDAVSSGQADLYHSADYYFMGQHPCYAFFAAVPFGMTALELNNWYYHGTGRAYHDELGKMFGLKSFLAGNTGAQAGGWFRKEINQPDDFAGLKFRMPGLGGKALSHLGASVQNIAGAEVYQALSSGALDGTEWIGPWADEKAAFYEVAKFYYSSGFHEPCAGLSLAVNRDVFESLSYSQQAAIEAACGFVNSWSHSQYLSNNGRALQRLVALGVKVREFPDPVWDAMGEASAKVYEEYTGDHMFREIFEDYRRSMQTSSAWIDRSVGRYRAQRDRLFG